MSRHFLTILLIVGVALLVACGSDASSSNDATPTGTSTTATSTTDTSTTATEETSAVEGDVGDATTRTVETARGPVEVPVEPQRVLALEATMALQIAADLGAPLVAAGGTPDTRFHVDEAARTLPALTSTDGIPDYEAIISYEPDLILTGTSGSIEDEVYDRLSQIAPTIVVFSDETRNDWRGSIMMLADALNRTEDAQQRLDAIEERIVELETAVAAASPDGMSVSLLRITDGDGMVRSYRTGSGRIGLEIVNNLAGVTITGNELDADSPTASNVRLSAERLREVEADVILYWGPRDQSESDTLIAEVTDNPLWPSLGAVQAGRAHQVSPNVWFDGFNFTAINLVMDDIFEYLPASS